MLYCVKRDYLIVCLMVFNVTRGRSLGSNITEGGGLITPTPTPETDEFCTLTRTSAQGTIY
jgi:hypothetical protein